MIKWYKLKEVRTIALVAAGGMGIGFLAFALIALLVYRYVSGLQRGDIQRHQEMISLWKNIKDKLHAINHLSFRVKKTPSSPQVSSVPSPPNSPPHLGDSMDQLHPDSDRFPVKEPA